MPAFHRWQGLCPLAPWARFKGWSSGYTLVVFSSKGEEISNGYNKRFKKGTLTDSTLEPAKDGKVLEIASALKRNIQTQQIGWMELVFTLDILPQHSYQMEKENWRSSKRSEAAIPERVLLSIEIVPPLFFFFYLYINYWVVRDYYRLVESVNAFEPQIQRLYDDQLSAKTRRDFRERKELCGITVVAATESCLILLLLSSFQ
ncbi:hypothetical protein RCOM_0562420 [Ricinus communis]|uniref:Uncharacterized protein n=1 Tax=Ricinus communis TaxID=3988 RepID=B9S2U9_RICCO|nr:hypothetical protein RCOM_0562420 [Ricinus communis]